MRDGNEVIDQIEAGSNSIVFVPTMPLPFPIPKHNMVNIASRSNAAIGLSVEFCIRDLQSSIYLDCSMMMTELYCGLGSTFACRLISIVNRTQHDWVIYRIS